MAIEEIIRSGFEFHRAGDLVRAEENYRLALRHAPKHPKCLHLLAMIMQEKERFGESIQLIRQAIQVSGADAALHAHLAESLRLAGQFKDAIQAATRAISLSAQSNQAYFTLALSLQAEHRLAEAEAALDRLLAIEPDHGPALVSLCDLHRLQGNADAAIAAGRKATVLYPSQPVTHYNLALALEEKGLLSEAESEYRIAVTLNPAYVDGLNNLGRVVFKQGDLVRATEYWQKAIQIQPNYRGARINLAFSHLALGQWREGWEFFESRLDGSLYEPFKVAFPGVPVWDGSDLNGKSILLLSEQGLGDMIQFARFIPMLAAKGARVFLFARPELAGLFKSIAGIADVVTDALSLPKFDTYCSLLSVPHALGITLDRLPRAVPYLHAPTERVSEWGACISADAGGLKVGLVWAGTASHHSDRERSIALAALAPLLEIPGISFFSLQKGPASSQIAALPLRDRIRDLGPALMDFSDTAAAIHHLDLVISVDTSVAHLAGALGKPVWTMIPFAADYRWMRDRDDSPWYPTMRLFRQRSSNAWPEVIERIKSELVALPRGG